MYLLLFILHIIQKVVIHTFFGILYVMGSLWSLFKTSSPVKKLRYKMVRKKQKLDDKLMRNSKVEMIRCKLCNRPFPIRHNDTFDTSKARCKNCNNKLAKAHHSIYKANDGSTDNYLNFRNDYIGVYSGLLASPAMLLVKLMHTLATLDSFALDPLSNGWLFVIFLPNLLLLGISSYYFIAPSTIYEIIRGLVPLKTVIKRNLFGVKLIKLIVKVWILGYSLRTFWYTGRYAFNGVLNVFGFTVFE